MLGAVAKRYFAVNKIGIIGAGQMGTGIGIVASRIAQKEVKFVDAYAPSLDKSQKFVDNWCNKEIAKERLSEADKGAVIKRISYHDKIAALNDCDFVIEAVNEDFDLKKKIFTELAAVTPKHAILASNTSSISITKIAGTIPGRAN